MSIIEERTKALLDEMQCFDTAQDRFEYIIGKYKHIQPSKEICTDENIVKGCVSNLWISRKFENGKCRFQSAADSIITKGVANLVCEFFDNLSPEEILQADESVFEKAGISSQLSANRRNGLSKLIEKILDFAKEHKNS